MVEKYVGRQANVPPIKTRNDFQTGLGITYSFIMDYPKYLMTVNTYCELKTLSSCILYTFEHRADIDENMRMDEPNNLNSR